MNEIIQNFNIKQVAKIKLQRDEKSFETDFNSGDTISVGYKIREGSVERVQAFIGVVIATFKSKDNFSFSFIVRKMSGSVGVERRFFLYSPLIDHIKINKKGMVRRSKLYYLRNLTGKAAKIKERIGINTKKKNS
jgi:large subunit ribosomal protein L19